MYIEDIKLRHEDRRKAKFKSRAEATNKKILHTSHFTLHFTLTRNANKVYIPEAHTKRPLFFGG